MKTIVSFCLPVYNVRDYLEPCIKSIYEQGLECFEIICVDDCSTDGSREELERLADAYPAIKVIHNEQNSGVSYTRNCAMENASGDYIWFVDPDDLLAPDAAKVFLRVAKETGAEAVLGNLYYFYDGSTPRIEHSGSGTYKRVDFSSPREFYCSSDQNGKTAFGVWLGPFSRQFLIDRQICFDERLSTLEDYTFYFCVGLHSTNIIRIDYVGYLYRIRAGSLSSRNAATKYVGRFECTKTVLNIYSSLRKMPEFVNNSRAAEAHITQMSEFAAIYLSAVTDSSYVRRELSGLKKGGFYPYQHTEDAGFVTHKKRTAFVIKNILPYEPLFWLFHFACRIRYQLAVVKQRKK